MFCCVKARPGSDEPGTGGSGTSGLASGGAATAQYNSSASAVAGVWLFVEIYGVSVLRARLPQYTVPCIMSAIIINISMTYAPQFSTIGQATNFIRGLLEVSSIGYQFYHKPKFTFMTTFKPLTLA